MFEHVLNVFVRMSITVLKEHTSSNQTAVNIRNRVQITSQLDQMFFTELKNATINRNNSIEILAAYHLYLEKKTHWQRAEAGSLGLAYCKGSVPASEFL